MNSHRDPAQPDDESKSERRRRVPASHVASGEAEYGIDRLRELLLDTERKEIENLRSRLDDQGVRASELVPLMPELVRTARTDEDFIAASTPLVEQSLRRSVRNHPAVIAEILYPVIGPAVWSAVSSAFRGLMDSLNTTLERNLTLTGLRWRWESYKTGRPIAELALLSSLAYRVEQVYLIEAESGIPLQYAGPESGTRDREMMSGMLTAIQDFVRASFSLDSSQQLDTLRVGDFRVWIERGPRAYLAAVIRGDSPGAELREAMRRNLQLIHRSWDGTPRLSEDERAGLRPFLEACLKEESVPAPPSRRRLAYAMLAVVVVVVAAWCVLGWLEGRRQADLLQRLAAEPGIAVIESAVVDGEFRVSGLRDPMARNPGDLVAEAGLDSASVGLDLSPYLSLESDIVLRRAMAQLEPPGSVSLSLDAGTLRVAGSANLDWLGRLRTDGPRVPGVDAVDTTQTALSDPTWESRLREIEAHVVRFGAGAAVPSPSDGDALLAQAARINDAVEMLRRAGFDALIEVHGGADASGTPEFNQSLSLRRAESVRDALVRYGADSEILGTSGQPQGGSGTGPGRFVVFGVQVVGVSDGAVE